MKVITAGTPEFETLWEDLFLRNRYQHPLYQNVNRQFYREINGGDGLTECSFVVHSGAKALMGVRATLDQTDGRSGRLSGYGLPLLFIDNSQDGDANPRKVRSLFRSHFHALVERSYNTRVVYQDFLIDGRLSYLGSLLLDEYQADAVPYFTRIIDLEPSEPSLLSKVRKSYKSLINWGKKNLAIDLYDHRNITAGVVADFHRLHRYVAGRETRSAASWDLQYDMVRADEAFVVTGRMDGELVTAALFCCSRRYCYYGVSASKRELFDKPLTHALIWEGICHARQRGCRFFETGTQFFPQPGAEPPTQKELTIATFKRGFGGYTATRLNMTVDLPEPRVWPQAANGDGSISLSD